MGGARRLPNSRPLNRLRMPLRRSAAFAAGRAAIAGPKAIMTRALQTAFRIGAATMAGTTREVAALVEEGAGPRQVEGARSCRRDRGGRCFGPGAFDRAFARSRRRGLGECTP